MGETGKEHVSNRGIIEGEREEQVIRGRKKLGMGGKCRTDEEGEEK